MNDPFILSALLADWSFSILVRILSLQFAGSACGIRGARHVENPHLLASHNACNEKAQEKEPDLLAKGKFAALKFVELEG